MRRMNSGRTVLLSKTSFRFQAVTAALLFVAFVPRADPGAPMGPLEHEVAEIYRLGKTLDPCELAPAHKTLRLDVARALDARAADLDEYVRSEAEHGLRAAPSVLKVGPLALTSPANAATASGWVSTTSGWEDLGEEWKAIRSRRVNARWVRLRELARATIADDHRRTVRGIWMGAGSEGVAEAPVLANLISSCLSARKCDGLRRNDAFPNALLLTPHAAGDFADYRNAANERAKERALRNLLAEIKPFATYFDPVKQEGVRFIDEKTLAVPLDAGDFLGFETELALVIEKFWKVGTNKLKVEWMTSTRGEPLFHFAFLTAPRSESRFDPVRRAVFTAQNAAESFPAYGAGRAMGFRARYFLVWRPSVCKYEDQTKPGDLLADGKSGTITADHWTALKRIYGTSPR